jgi:hypothetical protein
VVWDEGGIELEARPWVQISVGAFWVKELKTPSSAIFPASLITTPILLIITPLKKNPSRVLHPLSPKSAAIV